MCTNIMPAFIFLKDECSEFIVKSSVFFTMEITLIFFLYSESPYLCVIISAYFNEN